MSKDEIDCGNVTIIAIVLWLTSYAIQDASNIFEVLFTICVAFIAIVFGRMKKNDH